MRCLICGKISFVAFCKHCLKDLVLQPKVRKLDENFSVYSFYAYEEISHLLYAKYEIFGSRIYEILAKEAVKFLKQALDSPINACGIGIDDRVERVGYAHNGIFLKSLTKVGIKPIYGALYATNPITYAGKSLQFRKENPRHFVLRRKCQNQMIFLVDDIVTTGLTLLEAKRFLESYGNEVKGAFVLSDARE